MNRCRILSNLFILITLLISLFGCKTEDVEAIRVDCTADTDNDGVLNCDDACSIDSGSITNQGCPTLILNEVLYDPPDGNNGDANGDGTRDPLQDEFVEIYNPGISVNISGYTLSDAVMVRHTFPVNTIIPSKGVIVVFGGGAPTGNFGNAQMQTASEGQLNLNNAGDILTLKDSTGNAVAIFDINGRSSNPNESFTRDPDITGSYVQHSSVSAANGALFSPGRKVNGTTF